MFSHRRFLKIVMLFILAYPASSFGADRYVDALIAKARELKLAENEQWLALVHYQRRMFGGYQSQADDPQFFNAPEGRTDPQAELDATLAGFFSNANTEGGGVASGDNSTQCRFVARFRWLAEQLNFDETRFHRSNCSAYDEWRNALDPKSITLIYPAAFLNNPASSFGHSLLRVDGVGQDERTRLLAYGASYAASTEDRMGMTFAFKALFGGYVGNYAISPYYLLVRKYSDLESRDIWEYELELTDAEVRRIVDHLWELRGIAFDYYFFNKNCASLLLSLLEVGRPSLHLTEEFEWWAIPVDTVRATVEVPGLLRHAVYRPASNAILKERLRELSAAEQDLAFELALGQRSVETEQLTAITPAKQARVLELATEYLRYRVTAKRDDESAEEKHRRYQLLVARSKIDEGLTPVKPTSPQVRPDQGHKTQRTRLSLGWENDQVFYDLSYRPAFHDLMSREGGYPRGAELEFMDMTFRHMESTQLRLQELSLLNILSLSPRNRFVKPISWAFRSGARRKEFPDGERNLVYALRGGPGLAWEPWSWALVYGIFELATEYSSDYDRNYAVALGGEMGGFVDLNDNLRIGLGGDGFRFGLGTEHTVSSARLWGRWSMTAQDDLILALSNKREFNNHTTTATVSWNHFF